MRILFLAGPLLFLCASNCVPAQTSQIAAPTCSNLELVPAPRECTAVETQPAGRLGVRVVAGKDAEDQFAAKDLEQAAENAGLKTGGKVTISLERAETSRAKELLARHDLKLDSAMRDEGYVTVPDGRNGLAVIAETSAGIFYGAQTVKQLIRGRGEEALLLAPTLRDWPAMAHRGLSDDWSRGPMPTMDFQKRSRL